MSYYNSDDLIELENKVTSLKSECEELATALSALNVATANMCQEYNKTNLCKHVQSLLEKYGDK